MAEQEIGCSVHFIPLHMQPYYSQKYNYKSGDFYLTESVYEKIISLPLYPKMSEVQLMYVIEAVKKIVNKYRK